MLLALFGLTFSFISYVVASAIDKIPRKAKELAPPSGGGRQGDYDYDEEYNANDGDYDNGYGETQMPGQVN